VNTPAVDGRERSSPTPGSRGCQLPQVACGPSFFEGRLLTLSRPRSQPDGGHPIKIVVADDKRHVVEDQVNAERPQAVEDDTAPNIPSNANVSPSCTDTTQGRARPTNHLDERTHTVNVTEG
jgi:hypothetical protein